jgi:hypothetical protein
MNDTTMPENFHYGGVVPLAHPAYILAMLLAGLLVLLLRRDKAITPFVLAGMIIPYGQAVTFAGVHFSMLRLLSMIGMVRVCSDIFTEKAERGKLHPIDKAFLSLIVVTFVTTNILFKEMGYFIFSFGVSYTFLFVYCIVRHLIREESDVLRAGKALVFVGFVAAVVMILEQAIQINVFGYLGGEHLHPLIREGRVRSQAFFGHSIIAGCYGATLFPLCVWLWLKGGAAKRYALVGAVSSALMVVTSASSTPIMGLAGATLAFCFWPLRRQMRWVRRGLVATLILLHLVMHGPVWALIARINVVGGNSADHRYQLVNQCVLHFWDWWLVGTKENNSWGWDMWDTANQFVGTAESAGLLAFVCFVALFSRSFRAIGNGRAAYDSDKRKQFELWTVGCVIFTQLVNFAGVDYFDQTTMAWYIFLAMVVAITGEKGLIPAKSSAQAFIAADMTDSTLRRATLPSVRSNVRPVNMNRSRELG